MEPITIKKIYEIADKVKALVAAEAGSDHPNIIFQVMAKIECDDRVGAQLCDINEAISDNSKTL